MYDLYQADYRVRIYISSFFLRKLTEWEEGQASNLNTLLQCAICYEVGFGVDRDLNRSQELLRKCGDHDQRNFYRELESAKRDQYNWNSIRFDEKTNYQKLDGAPTSDNSPRQDLYYLYIGQEDLQIVDREYRKEITDAEIGLGPNHRFVLNLKMELMNISLRCGRPIEAEELRAQVVKSMVKVRGHELPRALAAKDNLAVMTSILKGRGRPKDSSLFCLQATLLASEDFGHLATVDAICTLTSIAANQGLWREAEDPSMQLLETSSKVLGQKHPVTLDHVSESLWALGERGDPQKALEIMRRVRDTCRKLLDQNETLRYSRPQFHVWSLGLQNKWTKAEALQKEIVHQNIKLFGWDNANTLSSMSSLAALLLEQRQLQKSKVLFLQVVELSEKILGKEHPRTLDLMGRLATIYQQQHLRICSLAKIVGKRRPSAKVEILHRQVVELSAKILGVEHPSTLTRTTWWAWILYEQKRFEEAEKVGVQIMETRARVLGKEHPETLESMIELAYTVRKRGRWKEARELLSQGLKMKPFLSRIKQQISFFLLLID